MTSTPPTSSAEPSPARAKSNRDPHDFDLFQWGPTKSAVILRDMANSFDKVTRSRHLHRVVGKALAKVDEMLDMVTRAYQESLEARKKNSLTQAINGGFKEHLVWDVVNSVNLYSHGYEGIPSDLRGLFRTVCKEKINIRKANLGVAPKKKGIEYDTEKVIEWSQSERVVNARQRWKANLRLVKYSERNFSGAKE